MSKKSPRFLRLEPAPEPRDPRFIDVILLVLLVLFERVWLFRRLGCTSSLSGLFEVEELGESMGPLMDASMSTSRSWCGGGYANDERNRRCLGVENDRIGLWLFLSRSRNHGRLPYDLRAGAPWLLFLFLIFIIAIPTGRVCSIKTFGGPLPDPPTLSVIEAEVLLPAARDLACSDAAFLYRFVTERAAALKAERSSSGGCWLRRGERREKATDIEREEKRSSERLWQVRQEICTPPQSPSRPAPAAPTLQAADPEFDIGSAEALTSKDGVGGA
ncbi:hypothetical protein KCU65_g423, partial [Aureobasidium melanogenum]